MNLNKIEILLACLLAGIACTVSGQTPIKDVLAQIDPSTGKANDSATEFTVTGIVAARLVLPDNQVLAFVHNAGEAALPVLTDPKNGANLLPRNYIKLSGKLTTGPFGAALGVNPGSVSMTESNKPFLSIPVSGALFKDATNLAGRYVQLTNVTFAPGKIPASGLVKAKGADGADVTVRLSQAAVNRDVPADATDVFGVIVKSGNEWQLVAARLLPVTRKQSQAIAEKRTCLSCHNPDTYQIGPSYRAVAAKYRDDPEAISKMILQMEIGGTGKWGTNIMVPLKALVPPEEMKTLAHWIYDYRWDALLAE